MVDPVDIKLARLEERLSNQIDRVSEIKADSSREIEQMRKGATENHNSLRLEMDSRFGKVDERFEKLSCEVKNVGEALQKGISDIALMFHAMEAKIDKHKAEVDSTKQTATFSWKLITVLCSAAVGAAGLVSFLIQNVKLG